MRKLLTVLVVGTLIVAMLAGCGQAVTPSASPSEQPSASTQSVSPSPTGYTNTEPVTISLFHGKQEAEETFNTIIEQFQALYPNITVEQEVIMTEMNAVLKARVAAGQIPDIMSIGVEVMDLATEGILADLTNEPFMSNINEVTKNSKSFTDADGKTWALPLDGSCIGVYYNKKIFADNGLTVPRTISELNNVLAVLKANGVTAFALGFKDAWTMKMAIISAFAPAVYANNQSWDDDKNAGTASFADTPGWTTSLELFKLIYDNGNTSTAFDTDYNTACAMVANGEAAMMAQGLWALEPMRAITPDIDLGIMGFPVSEDPNEAKLHQFPDFSLSISATTENPVEARLFLDFLTTPEVATLWSNSAKLFSAVKGVAPNFDPIVADINVLIAEGRIAPQGDRGWRSNFHAKFEAALPLYLLGNADLAATLAAWDQGWADAKAEATS